jgi:hypothetical protein
MKHCCFQSRVGHANKKLGRPWCDTDLMFEAILSWREWCQPKQMWVAAIHGETMGSWNFWAPVHVVGTSDVCGGGSVVRRHQKSIGESIFIFLKPSPHHLCQWGVTPKRLWSKQQEYSPKWKPNSHTNIVCLAEAFPKMETPTWMLS